MVGQLFLSVGLEMLTQDFIYPELLLTLANSADPDQMLLSVASDLGLTVCQYLRPWFSTAL